MGIAAFLDQKYLSLETFKKSGDAVRTPVWFAADPQRELSGDRARLYVYTIGNTGKVKRIRNNGRVRIAPCTMKGKVTGEWTEARAQIISGEEAERGMKLLSRKYLPWKQLLGVFAWFSRKERVVMAITPQ